MVSIRRAVGKGFRGFFALIGLLVVMGPGAFSKLGVFLVDVAASALAMVVVVYKRLRHNLGLTISAVLGVVAVMGMVVSVPIFSHAVSSKVLREQLMEKALSTNRGMFSLHMYYIDKRSATALDLDKAATIANYIQTKIPTSLGLDVTMMNMEVQTGALGWRPVRVQANLPQDQAWLNMSLFAQDLVPKYGEIVEGQWPQYTPDGPVQVAVLEDAANTNFINVGDQYRSGNFTIEVTGIWRPTNTQATIWFEAPNSAYQNKMWVPMETYRTRLYEMVDRPVFFVSWYVVVDETKLRFDRAEQYAQGLVQMDSELNRMLPNIATDYSPLEALNAYQERARTLATLFYAVGGPMIVLALLFISLTANIAMQQYEQETVTMRGRGTSWLQVASLNLIESLALIVGALPLSLLVGWGAAFVMSKTQSFLQFIDRQDIELTFQGINVLWLSLSALLIVIARFLPILSISRTSIVQLKQQRSRATGKPIWERFFLDFLLLLPGAYAYVTLSGMAKPVAFLSMLQPTPGEQYKDPLLFVAPSLFAMALCMIMLRLLPLLLRLLAKIVENLPGVWAYLSLQQVSRRPQDHSSALLLIMISLSLAIYSASTAKTLDKWLIDSAYYKAGSDVAVREYVVEGAANTAFGPPTGGTETTTISEVGGQEGYLSMEDHARLPGVQAVTRVGRYEGIYSIGSGEQNATYMGIDRLEFPKVAFYRDDFADQPLGALLNLLGADQMGVLVPREWMETTGLRVGDMLNASINVGNKPVDRQMTIVGTYDYWPTVFPSRKPVMIINLEAIFDDPESVTGYEVWMKLLPDADIEIVDYKVRQMIGMDRAVLKYTGNAYAEIRKQMDLPERVGLFGVLNVGFISTGLMPGIGFLLYSYASLRRRFIQLGILQAIGLSVRQLIGYLALEQFLLMGIAIVCGAVIGLVTSVMFVPFLQIGASREAPIPPFDVLIGWTESAYLSLGFGLVLILTMLGTIWYLMRMKVFQAVKMGEAM